MEADFFKASLLDTVIPDDTTTDLADLLEAYADVPDESNRLLAIKERSMVFFDEQVRTLAVLQIPQCDEETLKSYLARLSYKIDVWAIDEVASSDPSAAATNAPPKDLVFSYDGIQKTEPVVQASQSSNNSGRTLTLIWEVEIVLNRPRSRVPHPAIILIPSATVTALQSLEDGGQVHDLVPYQPLEWNVLEPMRIIPGLQQNPPYLAASRLERVLPVAATHKQQRIHIPIVPSRRHRVVPAAIARVRYSRVSGSSQPSTSVVALLDMEIIPFVQIGASIEQVDLSLKNGRAEALMPRLLPMQCQSGDSLTFMHKLHQRPADPNMSPGVVGLANPNIDVLAIKIQIQLHLSEHCRPTVLMDWTTHVDFTQPLNPSFGPPSQPIQRLHRPTSLPVNGHDNGSSGAGTVVTNTTSLQPTSHVRSRSGLSLSFTAPDRPAQVGTPFVWKVLVVNLSQKAAKITVIPLPRIQRPTTQAQSIARRHAPKSSTASFHPSERRHTKNGDLDHDIAQAVVDENVVYAMHSSGVVPPETDLMAVTAELRIGPLGPGQCHESDIQMVAFQGGCLKVDAMRVVDLVKEAEEGSGAPGVVVDIRDLPDVVVHMNTPDISSTLK